jgi:hypothetical protein
MSAAYSSCIAWKLLVLKYANTFVIHQDVEAKAAKQ